MIVGLEQPNSSCDISRINAIDSQLISSGDCLTQAFTKNCPLQMIMCFRYFVLRRFADHVN